MKRKYQIRASTEITEASAQAQIEREATKIEEQPKHISHCISPLVPIKYDQCDLSIMY